MGRKKSGYSKRNTDWLGRPIVEHYNSKREKTGHSKKGSDWLGRPITEHYNTKGDKTGYNKRSSDWLGRPQTDRYNSDGDKVGHNRKGSDWLGQRITERYNSHGDKTGYSKDSTDWLNRPITEHYTYPDSADRRSDSGPSGKSGDSATYSGDCSQTPRATEDNSFPLGSFLALGVVVLVAFLWLKGNSSQETSAPLPSQPSQTQPPQTQEEQRPDEDESQPEANTDSSSGQIDKSPDPLASEATRELGDTAATDQATDGGTTASIATPQPSTRRVFWAKHKHHFGSCEGQIQLNDLEFAFVGATHTLHLPRGSIRALDGTGVVDSTGKRWHFSFQDIPDSQARTIIADWYRNNIQPAQANENQ